MEHALADKWMVDTAHEIQKECERLVRLDPGERKLECEVWHQQGSGSHRFDMMGKRLYKTYVDLTNNRHNACPTAPPRERNMPYCPGAADDALSVGVMLDCIRVLTHTPGWSPSHAIIFDASHLFSTQHPITHTIRAFINLEAAGNEGGELLFQATSEEMIRAYSKVPRHADYFTHFFSAADSTSRPFGTVIANEVFSSGVLLSDTDFRQFEQYLNVPGLDMAVIGNSYIYHTRQDIVENIQPWGSPGRLAFTLSIVLLNDTHKCMGENVIAILRYLSSDASPLPSMTTGYTRPTTVFFSDFGRFIQYQFTTARLMYGTLFTLSLSLAWFVYCERVPGSRSGSKSLKTAGGFGKAQWNSIRAHLMALGGALVGANGLAAIMHRTQRNMSWFASEHSALLLYGPAALTGTLISQTVFIPDDVRTEDERNVLTALLLMQSGGALVLQLFGIGSAYFLFVSAVPLFGALSLDALLNRGGLHVSLWTYALGMSVPLMSGTRMACITLDVFAPLTGRFGADAPAEYIIASIVTLVFSLTVPLVTPFSHRFPRSVRVKAITIMSIATLAVAGVFALRSPFDEQHQRRLFVLSSDNLTSHERYLHVGAADGAPGFEQLVDNIAADFGVVGAQSVQEDMHDWNGDWDILYPFSAFMSPYKIPLPVEPGFVSPFATGERGFKIEAVNDTVDVLAGTRSLTLEITHPGLIWTVIAFDAHVLRWTLDDAPPDGYARHHIKEASFYGVDRWSVDLVLQGTAATEPLMINFVGIDESAMWPGKKKKADNLSSGNGHEIMDLFEKLDGWLMRKTNGNIDVMLLATVGGVISV
ncbi:hypothetical protein BGY98DRAFT_1192657 [Russula aff. rugulosa BPL654]|nr:hypothetical protein BGY98DRAFT_1192657 [Russula aff. rugulosa BPL654]